MKKLFLVAALACTIVSPALAKNAEPNTKIGRFFCYRAWEGDTGSSIPGHVVLSSTRLQTLGYIPDGLWYRVPRGTQTIEIHVNHELNLTYVVRYSNGAFYKRAKQAAFECFRKIFPETAHNYPPRHVTETRGVQRTL